MKNFLFLLSAAVLALSCSGKSKNGNSDFTVATYNIRLINDGDSANGNGWGKRAPHICALIRFHGFDIFGTQEGYRQALEDMKALLPGYEYIGVGRDDGAREGEHSAIFYNTEKFEVLDNGDFWLSETPDSVSYGWDAVCRRICTWGKFRNKETDDTLVYFNLHMDHIGTTAQNESAHLVLQKIKELPQGIPVMLTGDFNVDQNSGSYRVINGSGILEDAYLKAPETYMTSPTYNAYNPDARTLSADGTPARIDHIFLSPQFSVTKYGVLTDTYRDKDINGNDMARIPSDHYPVMVVVSLEKQDK